ncbi:hypothetical protein FRC18_008727 [Serendipita sp. 400]|nr:hypothetical protein FRC18_008727 [Serendipita sp. 400]
MAYYLGIDVGTGSARAALVTSSGQVIASHSHATRTWRSASDSRIFEQSTTDIFSAICKCIHAVLSRSGVTKEDVKGIGFDATCSLAVVEMDDPGRTSGGEPVCVTQGEQCGMPGERNIILWADHRAEQEANLINKTGSVVLDYVGGAMSLEMEIPKILWLKNQMPQERFSKCVFFDLPDYLTYLTTGFPARSSCSLVCKCSYIPSGANPNAQGWNDEFFKSIGLESMVEDGYQQLGGVLGRNHKSTLVLTAGMPVGRGLTTWAAEKMGLNPGTPVGSAVIDAYAGWIGTVAARHHHLKYGTVEKELSPSPTLEESQTRLATVAGTSTCYLIQSPKGRFVPGIWGPYKNALFPGCVTLEAIALQTRHILDEMKLHGHDIRSIYISGGQAKNIHLVQLLADVCQIPVILPNNYEASVVLGAAMLGRFGHEVSQEKASDNWEGFASQEEVDLESGKLGGKLWDIMVEMTQAGEIVPPAASPGDLKLLDAKYKIFRETIETQKRWRAIMEDAAR